VCRQTVEFACRGRRRICSVAKRRHHRFPVNSTQHQHQHQHQHHNNEKRPRQKNFDPRPCFGHHFIPTASPAIPLRRLLIDLAAIEEGERALEIDLDLSGAGVALPPAPSLARSHAILFPTSTADLARPAHGGHQSVNSSCRFWHCAIAAQFDLVVGRVSSPPRRGTSCVERGEVWGVPELTACRACVRHPTF
jgi:hypothetical protein